MKQLRVYAIDIDHNEEIGQVEIDNMTDEEFIIEAEKQGLVWQLKSFERDFNADTAPYPCDAFIRFIEVETEVMP